MVERDPAPAQEQHEGPVTDTGSPFLLIAVRFLYAALMIAAASIPVISLSPGGSPWIDFVVPITATLAVAVIVILLDIRTPRKRISNVLGVYLALVVGLFASLAVGALIDLIAEAWELTGENDALKYLTLLKLAVGLTLCYVAVSVVLSTRDSIRMVIPYVEFSRQVRGLRPMVLDSSALIDGRLNAFSQTGFMDAPLIVPQPVIDELHRLSDSADRTKRQRGRRGLANLHALQADPRGNVTIERVDSPDAGDVDTMLLELAQEKNLRIVTTDSNLARVAEIREVAVLSLHDLGGLLRDPAVPGEHLAVEIVRVGESPGQGVGFLPDGTMIVIDGASDRIGETLDVVVSNAVQTSAGRLVFAKVQNETDESPSLEHGLRNQPRRTGPGPNQS